jgi:hypothetical protein
VTKSVKIFRRFRKPPDFEGFRSKFEGCCLRLGSNRQHFLASRLQDGVSMDAQQLKAIEEARKTNPEMKMITPPSLSPERKAQLRQETIGTCLRYGLNQEHAEIFADAFEKDPKTAHLSLPADISEKFQRALASVR